MKKNNLILLQETIIKLLLERQPDQSICPSEVARRLYPDNWRDKMQVVRDATQGLVVENIIIVTQKNQQTVINAKGPIRLKLKQ